MTGTIVEALGPGGEPSRWNWQIHLHAGRHGNGMRSLNGSEPTRDAAMIAFRQAYERCIEHIGEEGWRLHDDHMAPAASQGGTIRFSRGSS
jgi:hypothetical protein